MPRKKKTIEENYDDFEDVVEILESNVNKLIIGGQIIDEVPGEVYELELDFAFQNQLDNNAFDVEWLSQNAPWNKLRTETKHHYELFKHYCDASSSHWNPESSYLDYVKRYELVDDDNNRVLWNKLYYQNEWFPRRVAYWRYLKWIDDRKQEIEHFQKIAQMRDNQASLLYGASLASIKLLEKLTQRIEQIDATEIRVTDIPKFIQSLSSFIGLAADAEARLLSISGLLEVLEDQIDRKIFNDNLFYIGHVQHKSQESINAES